MVENDSVPAVLLKIGHVCGLVVGDGNGYRFGSLRGGLGRLSSELPWRWLREMIDEGDDSVRASAPLRTPPKNGDRAGSSTIENKNR